MSVKDYFSKMNSSSMSNGGTDSNDDSMGEGSGRYSSPVAPPPKAAKAKPNTIEAMYQKKSQLEHILLRPDTYIGSVEPVKELMWVFNKETGTMVQRELTYVPGLYKIFDEILVNAADNKQRDSSMNCIKIEIKPEENTIKVWNNGKGIPVVEHKEEKMLVPTMIFGHLLTSSNYDDEEQKVTGGRNGFGAKLCNIFSTKFTVKTACKEYKKCFEQTWTNNMGKASNPITKEYASQDFTQIIFQPDLTKFKMDKLDDDIVTLMSRRAYDVAASTRGVTVYLNGEKIPVKSFRDYIDLYTKNKDDDNGQPMKITHESPSARWEVAVTISDRGFQQVSFVNSIATTKGGRHVDYVTDMIVKQLTETFKKKNKGGMNIKPFQVKNHMWVFVNCLIVNPTFDSQTKENMTLQAKSFGSKCVLSEKFYSAVLKSGIVETVLTWAKFKEQTALNKIGGKKQSKLKGVPKLEDANDAGTKNSINCTLILTEGDSAKSLAVSGLGVVGRDKYGVFPLRGKLLNVREATHKQILENAEINNIVKIVGLQYKKKYETMDDLKTLRYGRLMIMTDQDQDGSHIKGLIINFIHHNWPSLLKLPFLEEFITPIIKATKGSNEISFFSLPEFEEWKMATENHHLYRIKYYKGLGTSTSKEAKEYFSNMARHRILFKHRGDEDDEHIVMAFSKKCIEQRKEWLTSWMVESKRRKELGLGEDYLYAKDTRNISYKDFVNKELVLFSNMDNERSIPNLIDGLKPGSRKVLFTCLKRNDKREIKVAQLAGSVAEHSAYHHGETSLMSTIINLAQNYVGSNNINLLQPLGQFGTRLAGGKDAASPRYIFTMMSELTRLIFHPHDDPLLKYLRDDNLKIEPVYYVPIIPMVLVNGADGIGTGWMTKIGNHNPREIIENLHRMMRGEEPLPMKLWYKNFTGEIERLGDTRFVTSGEIGILSDEKIEITELPVGTWTQVYKETVLEIMLHGAGEKSTPTISDYKEYHTDTTVKFVVTMTREQFRKLEREGFHKAFKLQTSMSTASMCAFDKDCVLKRYENTNVILREFYDVRLDYYGKRKVYLEGVLQAEALKLSNQARFILEKCDGDLRIENRKKKEMIAELKRRNFDSDPVRVWKLRQDKEAALEDTVAEAEDAEDEGAEGAVDEIPDSSEDYDYLLGMKMWSLTLEKKNELLKKRDEKQAELKSLQKKSPCDLWKDNLQSLLEKLDEVEAKEKRDEESSGKIGKSKKEKGKLFGKPLSADNLPNPDAERVVPRIDHEMIKKVEKAAAAKERKTKKATENPDGAEDVDGDLGEGAKVEKKSKPKKEKKEKDPMKQTKLTFDKKTTPKKKKAKGSGSESEEFPDLDDSNEEKTFTPVRSTSRRAAANVKFTFSDHEENSEEEIGNRAFNHSVKTESGSEDIFQPASSANNKKGRKSDDDSDASFVSSNDSDSDDAKPKNKKVSASKKAPSKKAIEPAATKPQPVKKPVFSASDSKDEFGDSDSDAKTKKMTSSKKPSGPAKTQPPKKYVFSDSDSEDDGGSNSDAKPKKGKKLAPKKSPAKKAASKPKTQKKKPAAKGKAKGMFSDSDSGKDGSDDEYSANFSGAESSQKRRAPRQAAQKRPKYSDSEFSDFTD